MTGYVIKQKKVEKIQMKCVMTNDNYGFLC